MMHQMKGFEQGRMMHQAVGPIEIGVMNNKRKPDTGKEPPKRAVGNLDIELAMLLKDEDRQSGKREDHEGEHGIPDLASVILPVREFGLNPTPGHRILEPEIAREKDQRCEEEVPERYDGKHL
jgi:hypothetical protein